MAEGREDGLPLLEARLKSRGLSFPPSTRYVANADVETVRAIERGVLFLMAYWSGTSHESLYRLIEALNERPDANIELVVIDVDGSLALQSQPIPGMSDVIFSRTGSWRGNGETAWFLRGRVIATTLGGPSDKAAFVQILSTFAKIV